MRLQIVRIEAKEPSMHPSNFSRLLVGRNSLGAVTLSAERLVERGHSYHETFEQPGRSVSESIAELRDLDL